MHSAGRNGSPRKKAIPCSFEKRGRHGERTDCILAIPDAILLNNTKKRLHDVYDILRMRFSAALFIHGSPCSQILYFFIIIIVIVIPVCTENKTLFFFLV